MHEKIVANTSHCNKKRQCFGTPFVYDEPPYKYCSYLRGSQLPYISISFIDLERLDGIAVTGLDRQSHGGWLEMNQILSGVICM